MKNLKKILLVAGLTCLVGVSSAALASCKEGAESYTCVFNTNGGNAIANVTLEKGAELTLPIPEREGYTFEGWYTNPEFTGEPVTTLVASDNVTYYAKWTQLHAITLELNGGSLATTTVYLKVGDNIYNAIKDLTPTKEGLVFGAWFSGNGELSQSATMPEGGLVLSARYKIEYTVEIYLQNMDKTGYDKMTETGYAYVGEKFISTVGKAGFKEIETAETVTSLQLSENKSENVFKHYFDRQNITVIFRPNYPEGETGEYVSTEILYGTEVEIPYNYAMEGYCLIGWATSSTGEVVYETNYINSVLFNKEVDEEEINTTFVPEKTITLYGVWEKGYTDMFGGNDYIYLLNDSVYLSRGGVFFEGEYDAEAKEAIFYDANGDILLIGKINDDRTYVYESEVRDEKSCSLYLVGGGLLETTKVLFDKYNGIKYVEEGEDGKTLTSEGKYTITEEGYYVITFTEGDKAGETMTIIVGTITLNNEKRNAFQIRNEEDIALGKLIRFAVTEDGSLSYYTSAYDITLNGFGVASYNKGTSYASYYYVWNEDGTLTLQNANGQAIGVLRLMEELGMKGYMFYTEDQDKTFESIDGATLKLDGVCKAEYTNGTVILNGYYTTSSSIFGGIIVKMTANGTLYTFLVTETTTEVSKEVTNDSGETETVTETVVEYELTTKNNGYAEYYYQDASGTYYAPMMVVEEPVSGMATLYGYTSEKKYVKVSVGSYIYNEESGLYVYTAEEYFDAPDVFTDPIDLATIKSFVFNLDTTTTKYSVNYWYSFTTEEETTEYAEYYSSDKGAKLTLVGGFAIYSADGYVLTGTYKTQDNLMQISTSSGSLYLEFNAEEKTFITLDTAPYSASILLPNGEASSTEYMEFDGKGGATYVIVTPAQSKDEEDVYTKFVGTFTQTDEITDAGYYICVFTAEGKTFRFLQLTTSSAIYIAPYNEEYNGEYQAESGAILTIDGFGYCATFIDVDGTKYEGLYIISAENEITMILEEGYRYFDLLEDKGFTARATDYGAYILMDNSMMDGTYFEFNGYGKLAVYTMEENAEGESEKVYVDENGTYSVVNGVYTLTYIKENENIVLVGELGVYTYGSYAYNVFIVSHKEAVRTFVNENDWSVLILDDLGNAVKYDKNGAKEEGSYTLVTENLLYYVNNAATDACIYIYDIEKGIATEVELEERGYFTQSLDSLLFTKYGFAVFGGETRYYYNIEESGDVMIYREAEAGETANAYGFHKINFGKFTATKEYEDKTYYANDGFAIVFTRNTDTANNYPVLVNIDEDGVENRKPLTDLTFAPSGETEFKVTGIVNVDGKNYDCYVIREVMEDGTFAMYVTIGAYRFDIVVNYVGEDENGNSMNTYEVVGMKYIVSALSYTYMDTYYMYYSILGAYADMFVSNQLGSIMLTTIYNEAGEEVESYFTSMFGENSGFVDLNGNLIQIEKAEYEESESGLYTVTVQAEDGYTYKFYFILRVHSAFGAYGFINCAFTRVQTLTAQNGYVVEVERIITSEYGYNPGAVFTLKLTNNGEAIETESFLLKDGIVYCIVRTKGENDVITATEYYKVVFTEKDSGTVGEEESTIVAIYESVTVSKENIQTLYTEDGKSFVDISEKTGVMLLALETNMYVAVSCEYDEATQTYTVSTTMSKYTVQVVDGKVVITEVIEEEPEEV